MTQLLKVEQLTKVKAPTAEVICADIVFQKTEVMALLTPQMTPADFLQQLITEQHYAEAVMFLAHGLPKREAIWWAYLCARDMAEKELAPTVQILQAVERWVYKPEEEQRRVAGQLAEQSKLDTAASWAAMAVFWSGGSITPANTPMVAPAATLTAKAVSGAIQLAVLEKEPQNAAQKYQRVLAQGIDIANGGRGDL